jgi:hypothetical protein
VLTDLFKLDGKPSVLGQGGVIPPMSPGDTVANVDFRFPAWPAPHKNIKGVIFRGVSISKTVISKVTFTDCTFEDCLFIATRFRDVAFHGCKFVNCNLWKARFSKVYLDPNKICFERRYRAEAANVGISVFQALLSNFAEERQDHFFMEADIRFRRWKRFQIWYDLRRKRVRTFTAWTRWLSSLIYEVLAGFGYRPGRFFLATIFMFLIVSWFNYSVIGYYVVAGTSTPRQVSFSDAVFYSFSILTVLGFSSITPAGAVAKLVTVFEALAAIGWLGIFTSVLVKRFLR